jgi:hypothetical protein
MKKKYNELDNTFNISSEVIEVNNIDDLNEKNEELYDSKIISNSLINDIKKDYEYARGNIYSIIEKGQEALNSVLELAQETDSPRAYEVVGQLIKNVSDSTEKLMELQKKLKELEQDNSKKSPTNVTNALFVGSTAELSKLLKNQLKDSGDK